MLGRLKLGVLAGAVVLGGIWYGRSRIEVLCNGRWAPVDMRCVERDCAADGSCGKWKNIHHLCGNVRPGMSWSQVQYELGEPDRRTSAGYEYVRLDGNIEVEILDDVATAFRVGDLNQQAEEMVWEPWQRGEAAFNCYLN